MGQRLYPVLRVAPWSGSFLPLENSHLFHKQVGPYPEESGRMLRKESLFNDLNQEEGGMTLEIPGKA